METVLAVTLEKYITLFGQDTPAPRCQAQSKRSKRQCRKAAIRGKQVCRIHGGKSTGPELNKAEIVAHQQKLSTVGRHENYAKRELRSFVK